MIANANAANLPSTSTNSMMNQPVAAALAQQNTAAMTQSLAQRQQNQNPSMVLNQGMNALQQMKQTQQQLGGNNMFGGGAGLAQQRQV